MKLIFDFSFIHKILHHFPTVCRHKYSYYETSYIFYPPLLFLLAILITQKLIVTVSQNHEFMGTTKHPCSKAQWAVHCMKLQNYSSHIIKHIDSMNDSYKINIHESKKQKCTYKLLGTLKNLEQAALGELCFTYCTAHLNQSF